MDLSRYAAKLDKQSFKAGETIVAKGDAGSSMYIVVEGEVDVAFGEGRSVRLGAGQSFGEIALIDKQPRSATVTAVTDVMVAPISQGLFLVLVQDTPYFALEVMKSLADRLRNQPPGAEA